jgi:uncharacterized protein YdcH (DUF465 family)
MFPEYADLIPQLTTRDRQFAALLDKHRELDRKLQAIDAGAIQATRDEVEVLKKKKLGYKDQIYSRLRECSATGSAG